MKYNSIGEQLIAKAQELDPNYKPDKFNDMSEALDVILNNSGANNFIDLEFNIEDIINEESGLLNLDTFDFTLPANTLSEEMLEELALNKKDGFKLKFYFSEEEYGKIYYVNITAYPVAMRLISTNIVNMLGTLGYWSGSIEDLTIDNVFHFNELGSTDSLDKIWYELPSLFFLENITQEQFDEIKNLVLQNQLAGINCAGLYCPLTFYNDGRNINFSYPWYENDIFTSYIIRLNADLSVKKIPYSTITLPQNKPTSQLIPSITTSNKQQNLTIGNGLEIKNGALQATGSGGGGSSILRKDGTFVAKEEGVIANTISLSSEEYNRIKNGEITTIYGDFKQDINVFSQYKVEFSSINNDDMFIYSHTDILVEDDKTKIYNYQLVITKESANLMVMITIQPPIPTLPNDASTKTYALKAVNGVLTWVE